MEFLHGTSSKMPGVGDVRTESRRAQVICSTPKRSTTVRRSRLSRISRSSLRFSGPRSPGISPVSLTASNARDDFSDVDDFEESSFHNENHQRPTRIHGNISSGKVQHENFRSRAPEFEIKRAVPRWGVSQSQRKVQYEPLVIVSDEEEFTGVGKRGLTRKNQVKNHAGISSTAYRNSVRGSDSECESLDSGKGGSEAQVSIPVAMSSGPRVLEEGSHPRASFSTHKNINHRKTSVCQVSRYDSGMEEIQALPKESVLDLITSVQWKSGRACYEPLVIALSDEEDNDVAKKKKRTNKKMPTKLFNTNGRSSGSERRSKKIVVNASFDDYEDDREEDTEEDSVQNMSLNGTEDEYLDNIHREEEELIGQEYSSGDESYQSVRSHEAVRRRKVSSPSSLDNAEDILNESFCSNDEDEVLSGSATFNCRDHAREQWKLSYDRERHESVVRKPSCRVSLYGYGDQEEDKFEEDSVDFGTEYDLSGPCGDSSDRMFAMQKDMSGIREMQHSMNTSGPRNSLYKFHRGVEQKSKRKAVKGKPGRRRTVLQSSQTDSEENCAEASGKKPRKAPQKKSSLADDKEGCVKRKRGRPFAEKTGEGAPKPPRKPGRKRKLESQESSDNTSNNKTSDIEGPPTVKKTNKRINKSVAQSDTIPKKKPNARKRKSDECDPSTKIQETKKRRRAPKAEKSKKEASESTDSSLEKGSKDAVKPKRGKPPSKVKEQKKDSNLDNRGIDATKDIDAEDKSTLCEDLAGKRKSLHNPNASQGLTLNNEESSSSTKDDSQHLFPLSPRLVRKRSAESSSDYLRKKVLTMRLGKSICHQSLMENEQQLVTSTPVKPSSSRIALSSSAKIPEGEIVLFGNAGNGESQPTVNEVLERINEETEEDSKKDSAVKTMEEVKDNDTNKEQKNKDEVEKTSSNVKENPSEEKENALTLSVKKPKSPNKPSEKFVVDKILSEWPVDEICATSNEKLKTLSKPNKVKAMVNGREQEIEPFVEFSQIKFHKHKKQNIQYGPAVNTPTYGSGLVHLTPGSDKGVSVAKQCNFVYVVLGGLVEVKIYNETERLCKPGDFIVIPKGTKYNITGRGDKVSALIYFKCQGTEMI